MDSERKPGIKEWAKIRNRRPARYFKFWYQTNSGSEVMTDVMDEETAIEWLQNNSQRITAMHVQETMTSREAMRLMRAYGDDDD